jgi:hypothetical protein
VTPCNVLYAGSIQPSVATEAVNQFRVETLVLVSYWLTPWSRVLLENLIVVHLVKKFSAFYGTRVFITVFTRAHHWPLFWARWIQSTPFHPISLPSILMLSFHLRLGLRVMFSLHVFRPMFCIYFVPHLIRATSPAQPISLKFVNLIILGEAYSLWSSSLCSLLQSPETNKTNFKFDRMFGHPFMKEYRGCGG